MYKTIRRSLAVIALSTVVAANWQLYEIAEAAVPKPYSYNSLQGTNLDKSKTSQIYSTWVNYFDENNEWQPIDLEPKKDATGWHYTEAPYEGHAPLLANGEIKFVSTNRYDIGGERVRNEDPFLGVKKFTNALPVAGVETSEGILYKDALPDIGGSILLKAKEESFAYLVKWDTAPVCSGTLQIPFTFEFSNGDIRTKDGEKVGKDDGEVKGLYAGTSEFRGIGIKEAHIWDSAKDRKEAPVKIIGKRRGNIFDGYKLIDCSFFGGKTLPIFADTDSTFNPDPSGSQVSTWDGNVALSDATWATAWGGAAAVDVVRTDTANELARVDTSKRIDRPPFGFNTGPTIPDTDTVSATTFAVKVNGTVDNDDDGNGYVAVTAMSAAPASATAITDTDYAKITTTAWSGNDDIDSITADGSYHTWTFNATGLAGVSKTDVTWFMLRDGHDINNSNPDGSSGISDMAMAETTGTASDPILTVTHAAAAATGGPIIINITLLYFLDHRSYG